MTEIRKSNSNGAEAGCEGLSALREFEQEAINKGLRLSQTTVGHLTAAC